MTDNTQQARAAVTPEATEAAAKAILANNLEHVRQFRDWKVGDPVE